MTHSESKVKKAAPKRPVASKRPTLCRVGRPTDPQKDRDILGAAQALLFAAGPEAITMEKVAREAGVSKVTLYARYTNRHHLMCALLLAAVSNVATDIHSSLGRVPRDTAELREDLIHFADLVAAFLCSDAYQHLIQAISAIPKDMLDMTEIYRNGPDRTHRLLTDYLAVVAKQRLLQCAEPKAGAELLMGMILGLDLVRGQYRTPFERRTPRARRVHTGRVVDAFLLIHGARPAPRS